MKKIASLLTVSLLLGSAAVSAATLTVQPSSGWAWDNALEGTHFIKRDSYVALNTGTAAEHAAYVWITPIQLPVTGVTLSGAQRRSGVSADDACSRIVTFSPNGSVYGAAACSTTGSASSWGSMTSQYVPTDGTAFIQSHIRWRLDGRPSRVSGRLISFRVVY